METKPAKLPELELWQNQTWKNFCAVRQSLTQTETAIAEAMTQNSTVRHLAKNYPSKAYEAFKICLGQIIVIASIRQIPDQFLEAELWKYFQKSLQGFTFQDIRLAFTMNAAGELDQRIQHFQVLDISFVSQVMDLYLQKKISTMRRITNLLPPPEPEKLPSNEESYNGLIQYIKKTGEFPKAWAWKLVFDHMDECLMIEETIEARKTLYNQTLKKITELAELDALTTRRMIDTETLAENARNLCRQALIKKYLKL